MKFDKEHKDSLSKYSELMERMQSLLQNGEKITPKQWKAETNAYFYQISIKFLPPSVSFYFAVCYTVGSRSEALSQGSSFTFVKGAETKPIKGTVKNVCPLYANPSHL